MKAFFKIAASCFLMLSNLGMLIGNYHVIEFMTDYMEDFYEDLEPEGPFLGGPSLDFNDNYRVDQSHWIK